MGLQFDSSGIKNNVFPITSKMITQFNLANQTINEIDIPVDFVHKQLINDAQHEAKNLESKTVGLNTFLEDKVSEMNQVEASNMSLADLLFTYSIKPNSDEYRTVILEYEKNVPAGTYGIFDIPGFGTLEEFAALIREHNITNQHEYGGNQCLNYSNAYGAWIMQDPDVASIGYPGEYPLARHLREDDWNCTPFRPLSMLHFDTNVKEELSLKIIKQELDAGRPVVIDISDSKTNSNSVYTKHYGLAVRYTTDGLSPLEQKDITYIDSYDGNLYQLNTEIGRSLGLKHANIVWLYDEDYSHKWGTREAWRQATNNFAPLNPGAVSLLASNESQSTYYTNE